MQNNSLSRAELSNAEGEIMNVHYGDILVKYGDVLDIKKDVLTYPLDTSIVKKYQASVLCNGDVIIADAAEDESVGKCSEIASLTDEIVLSGLHTIPCRPKEKYAEGFLGYYMNSNAYHNQLLPLIQGAKVSSISKTAIQDTCIIYPKCKVEQEQIGACFRNLDYLITLHQRKELVFCYISYLVWEQRKLEGYLEVSREKNKDESYGKEDVLSVSGEYGIVNQIEFQGRSFAGASVANYGVVEVGDVVYTKSPLKSNPYGIIKTNKGKSGIVSTLYAVYKPRLNTDSGFVQIYFELDSRMNSYMHPLVNKGAKNDMKVSDENALKGPIIFPKLEEQKAISQYFSSLDALITLHQCKCNYFEKLITNVWEQRKFGELAVRESNCDISSVDMPCVEYDDVIANEGQLNKDISLKEVQKKGITFDGSQVLYGKLRPYLHNWLNPDFMGVAVGDWWVLRPVELDKNFLYRLIQTQQFDDVANQSAGSKMPRADWNLIAETEFFVPSIIEEQARIGEYFTNLDTLITLHQCKYYQSVKNVFFAWEQRKLNEIAEKVTEKNRNNLYDEPFTNSAEQGIISQKDYFDREVVNEENLDGYYVVRDDDFVYNPRVSVTAPVGPINRNKLGRNGVMSPLYTVFRTHDINTTFLEHYFKTKCWHLFMKMNGDSGARFDRFSIATSLFMEMPIPYPNLDEQAQIGCYFDGLDKLITLHQRKQNGVKNALKYIKIQVLTIKETIKMPELEAIIEKKLIEQLVYGDSQWTYREDLKTEADLWANFKYILEQNNKDRLNGENLSDSEFEQVKNQLQFSSFYKAGEWLVGENGKVMVHVQRDTERLHLVVMNHEHIAGGSSVYEVINQYTALADEDSSTPARDRRFDVTLMINGLPMIHIELKNKQHSYMDGFWQIKKYIGEGKFTGIFSAVQMFVISNGVNTKYFSAASDTELNPKFISGWLDKENNPVADYLDFAKCVLRIPEAHEMIARYTVLDEDAKRLILLRPYQIHAIESIREASKRGKSGFVWHTTGSGKTLTSYKATRNLLMDIPAIDKAIFLIDRKDLDTQTTMAFQAYANNDLIDVDETDNVNDLKKKLKSDDRQVIVTTIQKLQRLITKRLSEGTPEYSKIKNLKIAFVVDECHRAVTPSTKRELERFFGNSLWFGFTGTPRFAENPYPQLGDLPRTTEELYGERLHKYTIQNAIHDNAVLGFQVEHNGPKNISDETDSSAYENETHMLKVLDVILNKSYHKLGFPNGKGKTYEALLTTSSIQMAQRYYELLTRVKNGETSLVIDEKIKQVLPDFPKFAITYSVSENEEGSHVNQQKMQESLDDYNGMFGTKYDVSQIQGYNGNLNKRLARKDAKFQSRNEQLDLVIVVDRLLTGFDAPCMSTIFIDRQPMGPHDLIQAFSRTNRIFDKNKTYGQIVTFQAPVLFKKCVDNAVKLYSAGGTKDALLADWEEIVDGFKKALAALRVCAATPGEVPGMSLTEKKMFAKIFQNFDKLFAQLKSFTQYDDAILAEFGITEDEYYDYAGHYLNVLEEIKPGNDPDPDPQPDPEVDPDYELMAYSNTKIDYEYIINLIQNIVTPKSDEENITPEERQKKIDEVKQYVEELRKENPKVADIMSSLIYEIELDETKYRGQSILNIVENMKSDCIDRVITDFCITWYASKEDVMYAATHYRNGEIPNESAIKATIDFTSYKEAQEKALPKFKYYAQMMAELRKTLEEEIKPLISH